MSSRAVPGSKAEWPESDTMRKSASGQALCRAQAAAGGVQQSWRPWTITPGMWRILAAPSISWFSSSQPLLIMSPDELIADIKRGLYVTEMIGSGVNAVTGDYSRGASGFIIENGEITRPVAEITVAGNLIDMCLSGVDRTFRDPPRSAEPLSDETDLQVAATSSNRYRGSLLGASHEVRVTPPRISSE